MFSFDLGAVSAEASPGSKEASPNGLSGEAACKLSRYAGMSDKLTSFGIYNYVSTKDKDYRTSKLIAQMMWYFTDGYNNRMGDYPVASIQSYTKYIVGVQDENLDLSFYKSEKSGRWWIEVPYPEDSNSIHHRHLIMPCSYKDYLSATEGQLPDRWWKTYQKIL